MASKEQARKISEALMVCTSPDVCKSPVTPVPYQIVSNFINSEQTANTVNSTKDPTFTKASYIQGVIGDEAGTGGGVISGTYSTSGCSWATDWSETVQAEGQNVVRNGDPADMNGHSDKSSPNTQGKVVYPKSGAPSGSVGANGMPTSNTNPGQQMQITQYGYKGDPDMDKYTAKGEGAFANLQPDVSAALTQSAQKALGAQPGDYLKVTFKDGTSQIRRFDDRAPESNERMDLYQKEGFDKSIPDIGSVSVIKGP